MSFHLRAAVVLATAMGTSVAIDPVFDTVADLRNGAENAAFLQQLADEGATCQIKKGVVQLVDTDGSVLLRGKLSGTFNPPEMVDASAEAELTSKVLTSRFAGNTLNIQVSGEPTSYTCTAKGVAFQII